MLISVLVNVTPDHLLDYLSDLKPEHIQGKVEVNGEGRKAPILNAMRYFKSITGEGKWLVRYRFEHRPKLVAFTAGIDDRESRAGMLVVKAGRKELLRLFCQRGKPRDILLELPESNLLSIEGDGGVVLAEPVLLQSKEGAFKSKREAEKKLIGLLEAHSYQKSGIRTRAWEVKEPLLVAPDWDVREWRVSWDGTDYGEFGGIIPPKDGKLWMVLDCWPPPFIEWAISRGLAKTSVDARMRSWLDYVFGAVDLSRIVGVEVRGPSTEVAKRIIEVRAENLRVALGVDDPLAFFKAPKKGFDGLVLSGGSMVDVALVQAVEPELPLFVRLSGAYRELRGTDSKLGTLWILYGLGANGFILRENSALAFKQFLCLKNLCASARPVPDAVIKANKDAEEAEIRATTQALLDSSFTPGLLFVNQVPPERLDVEFPKNRRISFWFRGDGTVANIIETTGRRKIRLKRDFEVKTFRHGKALAFYRGGIPAIVKDGNEIRAGFPLSSVERRTELLKFLTKSQGEVEAQGFVVQRDGGELWFWVNSLKPRLATYSLIYPYGVGYDSPAMGVGILVIGRKLGKEGIESPRRMVEAEPSEVKLLGKAGWEWMLEAPWYAEAKRGRFEKGEVVVRVFPVANAPEVLLSARIDKRLYIKRLEVEPSGEGFALRGFFSLFDRQIELLPKKPKAELLLNAREKLYQSYLRGDFSVAGELRQLLLEALLNTSEIEDSSTLLLETFEDTRSLNASEMCEFTEGLRGQAVKLARDGAFVKFYLEAGEEEMLGGFDELKGTIEFWFKPGVEKGRRTLVYLADELTPDDRGMAGLITVAEPKVRFNYIGADVEGEFPRTSFKGWHHIAVQWNLERVQYEKRKTIVGEISIVVDGGKVSERVVSVPAGMLKPVGSLYLGNDPRDLSKYAGGSIDNLRISSKLRYRIPLWEHR